MNGAEYAAVFARETEGMPPEAPDTLLLPEWRVDDWEKLLSSTTVHPFKTSDVVIKRDVEDRALNFVAAGVLEVGVTHFDGVTTSTLARIGPGSVIGEQSFFDAQPRSANVWAVSEGALLRWEFEAFKRFGADEPRLCRDVLFAVGRVLSTRLRTTTIRVRR
jgi:CRP/FNR family cyclic AMP-dependent transcriptional regulator